MFVVIAGCGKLGSYLANLLSLEGQDVIVIDKDSDSFSGLDSGFSGFALTGDATEIDILEQARLRQSDLLVACTENDNVNMMVAQIARDIFKVKKVMARVFDPERASIYRDLNIETICPTQLSAMQFRKAILGNGGGTS
jgi:trk system potassium uptake protein TrkA